MGCVPWALKEGRFPTMAELDGVCPDHPVFICAVTFHSSAVNTRGFELIGIDPNLHGVEKDSAGRPTGSFLSDDSHFFASTKVLGSFSDEELADLVVLDGDPYREPERIKDFRVKMTIVAGKVVYRE